MKYVYIEQSSLVSKAITVSSDKSISHRAIIVASLSEGTSILNNILISEDTERTIDFFKTLGVKFFFEADHIKVVSLGYKNFHIEGSSKVVKFNMGNSGTSCRILMGIACALSNFSEYKFIFEGDSSLTKRPMKRVISPLMQMGAKIESDNNKLPITIYPAKLKGISYTQEVPSAQVKSSIIFATLVSEGEQSIVYENTLTRNHTENLLNYIGINISIDSSQKTTAITIQGSEVPNLEEMTVPADASSSSFFVVATLMQESCMTIKNVNVNPARIGFIKALQDSSACIEFQNKKECYGELVADVKVSASNLNPINISENIPYLIDEVPILAVLASSISGVSIFENLEELKYKESDRLNTVCTYLNKIGVEAYVSQDNLIINGTSTKKTGGVELDSVSDHRIAMSFLLSALICNKPIYVYNYETINTSFPSFFSLCSDIGIEIKFKEK